MRTLLFLTLLLIYSTASSQTTNTKNLIASCCTETRGCNGSDYCTACKNCTGCKHCAKNGGTCGVCSTRSTKTYSSSDDSDAVFVSYTKGDILYVVSKTLNLREKPSSKGKIIEVLSKDTQFEFIEVSNTWLKVKVIETNTIGYVYAKYVSSKSNK